MSSHALSIIMFVQNGPRGVYIAHCVPDIDNASKRTVTFNRVNVRTNTYEPISNVKHY